MMPPSPFATLTVREVARILPYMPSDSNRVQSMLTPSPPLAAV